jgi:hypothetical protein
MMMAKRDRTGGKEYAGQIAEPRQDYRVNGFQRVRIDNSSHSVGRIVKTVDKLETQGNQQRQGQQKIRPDAGDGDRFHVPGDVQGDVAQTAGHRRQKQRDTPGAGTCGHLAI